LPRLEPDLRMAEPDAVLDIRDDSVIGRIDFANAQIDPVNHMQRGVGDGRH
jgi:hypothetical protein